MVGTLDLKAVVDDANPLMNKGMGQIRSVGVVFWVRV